MSYGSLSVRLGALPDPEYVAEIADKDAWYEAQDYVFIDRTMGLMTMHMDIGVRKSGHKEVVFLDSVIKHHASGLVVQALKFETKSYTKFPTEYISNAELKRKVGEFQKGANLARAVHLSAIPSRVIRAEHLTLSVRVGAQRYSFTHIKDERSTEMSALVKGKDAPYFLKWTPKPGESVPEQFSGIGPVAYAVSADDDEKQASVKTIGDVTIYSFDGKELVLKNGVPLLVREGDKKELVKQVKGDSHLLRIITTKREVLFFSPNGLFEEWKNNGFYMETTLPTKLAVAHENFWGTAPVAWTLKRPHSADVLKVSRGCGSLLSITTRGRSMVLKNGILKWKHNVDKGVTICLAITKKLSSLSFLDISNKDIILNLGDFQIHHHTAKEYGKLDISGGQREDQYVFRLKINPVGAPQDDGVITVELIFPKFLYTVEEVLSLLKKAGFENVDFSESMSYVLSKEPSKASRFAIYRDGNFFMYNTNKEEVRHISLNEIVLLNAEDYIKERYGDMGVEL